MHIYFSGIGGVGIGPLAMLAQDAGHNVSGSDKAESSITRELKERNVPVSISQSADAMKSVHDETPIDLCVHSAAIAESHPEIQFAKQNNIPTAKRDELINKILKDKDLKLVAISGTHGKTTSTGMAVWALKQLGIPVSYSVGSQINFGSTAAYEAGSEYFIYEADEFDKNMLKFKPFVSLITSIDFDHPDTYKDERDYQQSFSQFASQSDSVYVWKDDASKVMSQATITILDQKDAENVGLTLRGNHNRTNAFMVASALAPLTQKTIAELSEILNTFPGTARRFEKISDNLYTDYAHHPVEIEKTLQLAREINNKVVIVYQPHQNIRQHELHASKAYADAFVGCDKVYWLPTYLSREDPSLATLTPQDLIADLSNKDITHPAEMDENLKNNILQALKDDALVVAMSAGDLDAWIRTNF